MQLSHKYYRFSEYKCTATYMHTYYPHLLKYHHFDKYGSKGIRIRDYNEIIDKLSHIEQPITYTKFLDFANRNFPKETNYVQIEHLPEIA